MNIYDLDGTVFKGNSFTRFVVWLFNYLIKHLLLPTASRLFILVLLRKLRRISHSELKFRVVAIAASLPPEKIEDFVNIVGDACKPRLESMWQTYGRTQISVLATAAPEIYAKSLASMLNFDYVICSGFRGTEYIETIRETKRNEAVDLARRLETKIGLLFTDHIDDVSLGQEASGVVIVDAGADTVAAFTAQGIFTRQMNF